MSKFYALLSSLLFVTPAYAESEIEMSGFAYATLFSDSNLHDNRYVTAMNADYSTDLLDFKGQISNYTESPIRRLTVERSFSIGKKSDVTIKLGRFSRINSLYNNILDTPASTSMAMLPMASYPYRFFSGAFTIMDGAKVDFQTKLGDHALSTHFSYGDLVIGSQDSLQNEFFRTTIKGMELASTPAYTVEQHYEHGDFKVYASRSEYNAYSKVTELNPTSNYIVSTYKTQNYHLDKAGIKWDNGKYLVMYEASNGDLTAASVINTPTYSETSTDNYLLVGFRPTPSVLIYTGQSISDGQINDMASRYIIPTGNKDTFAGISSNFGKAFIALEYHRGSGQYWMKYDALAPHTWSSWVTSVAYQF